MSLSHWLIVLVVLLLFFGPKKLAGLGKSLGEGMRGLREGLSDADDKDKEKKEKKSDEPSSSDT